MEYNFHPTLTYLHKVYKHLEVDVLIRNVVMLIDEFPQSCVLQIYLGYVGQII